MKKATIVLSILFMMTCLSPAKTGSLTLGAGMRSVSESLFEDVYGKNNVAFAVDLGFDLGTSIQVFFHTDYLSKEGQLTFTLENTKFTLIPLELGARFLFGKNKFKPYLGAGLGYYMYKEENVIGTVDEKKFGFFGEGGLRFLVGRSFFIDLKLKNVFLKVDGAQGSINLGGFAYMGGIGIVF